MQIFIDSCNLEEIKTAYNIGIINGLTTNPSLIKREKIRTGKRFQEIVKEICKTIDDLPVSVEVLATTTNEMIEEGRMLHKLARNVVVKLPATEASLRAICTLSSEEIKVNVTLCFSPLQALLVAKAGATYVSPFVGRLDDQCEDGMQLVANIRMIYANYGYQTKILVASIRNPLHILNAARIGADCVTVPFYVIQQLMKNPLTEKGIEIFLNDAKTACQDNDK